MIQGAPTPNPYHNMAEANLLKAASPRFFVGGCESFFSKLVGDRSATG